MSAVHPVWDRGAAIAGTASDFPVSPEEWERRAAALLPAGPWGFIDGGAASLSTVRENRAAFERWRLVPRMLASSVARDLAVSICGTTAPAPIFLAPIGVKAIAHADGEIAVASLIKRAERPRHSAVVVALDTPMLGWRERDPDNPRYLPFNHGAGLGNFITDPVFQARLAGAPADDPQRAVALFLQLFNTAENFKLSCDDLRWLRSITDLLLRAKGVLGARTRAERSTRAAMASSFPIMAAARSIVPSRRSTQMQYSSAGPTCTGSLSAGRPGSRIANDQTEEREMYYALNLFDFRDQELYRQYMRVAGPIVENELGGQLICMGELTASVPVQFPNTTLGGGQKWMVIAAYPTEDGPKLLFDHPQYQAVKELRDLGTRNYVWAYYRKADVLTE